MLFFISFLFRRSEHVRIVFMEVFYRTFRPMAFVLFFSPRIEHLEPTVLDAMPAVVFGSLTPKVVIVTTPNVEFNVLFPGLQGFRHWDHKFEWTRAEFEDW